MRRVSDGSRAGYRATVYLPDRSGVLTSTIDYQEDPSVALAKLKDIAGKG